jgi:hypothetical protein
VIDLRNIYRPEEMAQHGFIYDSIGRMPFGRPLWATSRDRARQAIVARVSSNSAEPSAK